MEYEKPEQPPPTTPTRRPAGTGFCCAITSFTLLIAVGVKLRGLVSTLGTVVVGAVVVVAISSFLLNLEQIIAKTLNPAPSGCAPMAESRLSYWMSNTLPGFQFPSSPAPDSSW